MAAAAALLFAAGAVSATEAANSGSHTVSYEETTAFGFMAGSSTSGGGAAGCNGTVPNSAVVRSFNETRELSLLLPSFTITANSGWLLSNPSAFIGNLVFTELMGGYTSMTITADVAVNGMPAMTLNETVNRTATLDDGDFITGYDGQTFGPVSTGFSTLSVANASVLMSATGGGCSSASLPSRRTGWK